MIFKVHAKNTLYQGRVFALEQWNVTTPDGRETTYDLIAHPGAVTLLPLDDEGQVLFIRQHRLGAGGVLLELPAGTLEDGEDPSVCAGRELREETGMSADQLTLLGDFYMVPGYSTEHMWVYLATGLRPAPLAGDLDEFIEVEPIPLAQVWQMAAAGEIHDGKSLASLLLAQKHLNQGGPSNTSTSQ
ncbi:MAG: NUDIX hydrolase [Anaerolineae bacterium]|nr:NUDIX hydrolase [Anaerolineae bacterium]